MKKRKSIETGDDLVRAFADLFDEVEPETSEEIDTVLREAGYDPDEVAVQIRSAAEQALASSPLNWRIRAQEELENERARFERIAMTSLDDREDIISAIQRLLAQLGNRARPACTHFRNFESATYEDLASLLSELEYLASQQGEQREG